MDKSVWQHESTQKINWHNLWASIEISTCAANRLHADEIKKKKRDFHDDYHVHRQRSPRTHISNKKLRQTMRRFLITP